MWSKVRTRPGILDKRLTEDPITCSYRRYNSIMLHEAISIYLILSAALGPGVYSASNRNEYQKQKNNVSGG
jgi:hypothetical protein